jgi:hypothetical protein
VMLKALNISTSLLFILTVNSGVLCITMGI